MKKKLSNLLLLPLVLGLFSSLASCARDSSVLEFWIYGDANELDSYNKMVDEFNKTYGLEHDIKVQTSTKPVGSGYTQVIQYTASSKSGPDIFMVTENEFKKWVDMDIVYPLTDEFNAITDIDFSDIPENVLLRTRYNKETNSSARGEPQYGMPIDTKATALYYNETFMKKAGIIVISVDEEDMEAWNRGEIADRRGKKKSDFPKIASITIPKKGFYRSINPYVSGYSWSMPQSNEIMVFNNRIACNWDEIEDLAMLFTPSYNPNYKNISQTLAYGYFTEWWFNYGWSVGGDCLADLSGTGEFNFSLLDPAKNYIVVSDEGFEGTFTGKHYIKGETLDIKDKYECSITKKLVAMSNGNYSYDNGDATIRQTVKDAANNGILAELPSTREAFCRYLKTGISKSSEVEGKYGLAISPNPATFSNRTPTMYFYSGKIALLVESSAYMQTVSQQCQAVNYEWDIAPLAQFKEYEDPFEPSNDTVVARGKAAGHSNSKCLVTREMCDKKESVAKFIAWCASKEGQRVKARYGFFPNQVSLKDEIIYAGSQARNVDCFFEHLEFEGPGDWWYLRNYTWVDLWANTLNANVRNDKETYESWKNRVVDDSNRELREKYWLSV
ncbi:MAG: extracellular solute-binding protein [Bacilli bacterium]